MDRMKLTWSDVDGLVGELTRQITVSEWTPDRVVGLARGGLPVGVMISHYYGVPFTALQICLRDHKDTESNLWLAENAFGYCKDITEKFDFDLRENILIIDDICDTGSTFDWIREDWKSSCFPDHEAWNTVWHKNVRFAALVHNQGSGRDIDYAGKVIDKRDKDQWLEFPWEDWWRR